MEGYKTLIVSLATALAGIGAMFNLPIAEQIATWASANVEIMLAAVGAVFALLRMVTSTPAAVSLKK